jgi:hypothetical protein
MNISSSAIFSSVKEDGNIETSMKLKYSLSIMRSFFLSTMPPLFYVSADCYITCKKLSQSLDGMSK